MSVSALCRLCLNVSKNIKYLYDENGQGNGVYEIAVKYFHPMFLSVEQNNPTAVICHECWRHISVFHNYQQSVFQAQRNFLVHKAEIELERSSEGLIKCDVSTIKKYDEDSVSLPDIEFMEEFMYDDPMTQAVCSLNNSLPQNDNGLSVKHVSDSGSETTVEQIKQNSICHNNKNENNLRQETTGEQVTKHALLSKEDNFEQKLSSKPQVTVEKITNDSNQFEEDDSLKQKDNLKSQITVEMTTKDSKQSKDGRSVKHKDNLNSQAIVERISKDSIQSKKCQSNNSKFQTTVEKIKKHATDVKKKKRVKKNRKQSITKDKVINLDDIEEDDVDQQIAKRQRRSQVEIDNCISQWRDQLECAICKKGEQNFLLLQAHFRHEHPQAECYIVCCNRKLNTRTRIEEHARFHTDPNAFKCQICGYKFTSESNVCKHRRECHPKIAPKYVTRTPIEEIDKFIALYKSNLECDLCQRTYKTFTGLRGHFSDDHNGKEFYVLCCQRRFNRRSVFKEHVWLHMDPDAFRCKICQDVHNSFRFFKVHMKRAHGIAIDSIRADQFLTDAKLLSNA